MSGPPTSGETIHLRKGGGAPAIFPLVQLVSRGSLRSFVSLIPTMSRNDHPNEESKNHDDNTQVVGDTNQQHGDANDDHARIYILLENPRKNNNLGPLLRCAVAFGVYQVVAVGYAQCSVEGSHGASKHIPIVAFPTAQQALQYLRQEAQCRSIIGIAGGGRESVQLHHHDHHHHHDTAVVASIHDRPFQPGNTCFVISKSKSLPEGWTTLCDSLLFIPHMPILYENTIDDHDDNDNTPSNQHQRQQQHQQQQQQQQLIDAPICLSIVLHHYTEWYGSFQQRKFQGHKYQLRSQTTHQHYSDQQKKHMERKLQKEQNDNYVMDNTTTPSLMDTLFGESGDY